MRFSQRIGKLPASKLVQRETIDEDLRNSLWSLLTLWYWDTYKSPGNSMYGRSDFVRRSNLESLIVKMWLHYYKMPIDTIDEYWGDCHKRLRTNFFNSTWNEVFDFIEFIAENSHEEDQRESFVVACNSFMERENSAYRFINGVIAEITSEAEIQEVEDAITLATPYAGVKTHLVTALSLLSSRTNPDYRNSIKESISAVESLAKHISNDQTATLGAILKELEKSHSLHPALKSAFSSLYGYTSDAQGIRHALMNDANLTKTDARFMLVCCSAFVNYAIDLLATKGRSK